MGDRESVYGFAAVGLDVIPVQENDEAGRLLRKLAESDYAIIYMTERVYHYLHNEIAKYEDALTPAIVPIPGVSGTSGLGVAMIKKSVERAIGSDILFGGKSNA
jgi:V/A-type H+-transporting ATPase subunit F